MYRPKTPNQPAARTIPTAERIRLAIIRIEKQRPKIIEPNRKLSVASVAEEAETTRANIYNNYPELAEKIQLKTNKAMKLQRDTKQTQLKELREKYQALKKELKHYKALNSRLASEQAKLIIEIDRLSTLAQSENVTSFGPKK